MNSNSEKYKMDNYNELANSQTKNKLQVSVIARTPNKIIIGL